MKILMIGDGNNPYIIEHVKWLRKTSSIEIIDLYTFNSIDDKQNESIFNNVFSYHKKINLAAVQLFDDLYKSAINRYMQIAAFLDIEQYYDIIQIHYVEVAVFNFLPFLKQKGNKSVLTIWGSDLLRSSLEQDQFRKMIYEAVDVITVKKNEFMLNKLSEKYPTLSLNKIRHITFGADIFSNLIDLMDNISKIECKKLLSLDIDKIIVTIGYSSNEGQRHKEIIDSIITNQDFSKISSKVQFFLPLTYGDSEAYKSSIINYCYSKNLDFVYFDKYLSQNQVSMIRYASDVFVHLATTDVFCNSLREYMLSKNVVITGDWFPYNELIEQGFYFRRIHTRNEVGKELLFVLNNFSEEYAKCSVNDKKLLGYSDWPVIIKDWIKLYEEVLSEK